MSSHKSEEDLPDPFFALDGDPQWNAYIGRQSSERAYVGGYLEAALELVAAIIDKRLSGSRDTLVMPILYNARHGVELAFKSALRKLRAMGIKLEEPGQNHDIVGLWKKLSLGQIGDEVIREVTAKLKPYVLSLGQMDEDGQEFRYPYRRDGTKSLKNHSLANLERIRASLTELREQLELLDMRIDDLQAERATRAHTNECSRRDLLEISRLLPARSEWDSPAFAEAKAMIISRFSLSNSAFSRALDLIQRNPPMGMKLGIEFELRHLSPDRVLEVLECWAPLHPPRPPQPAELLVITAPRKIDNSGHDAAEERAANEAVKSLLSPDELADLEAVYYLGRNREFGEHYDEDLARIKSEHQVVSDSAVTVQRLLSKTNFATMLADGACRVGCAKLAKRIADWRPDLFR